MKHVENKNLDNDQFQLESSNEGPSGLKNASTSMTSSNQLDYRFGNPITYPTTAPKIVVLRMGRQQRYTGVEKQI